MYRKVVALGIAVHSIFTVDVATGAMEQVYADTGAFPDGLQIADGVAYWTTMGKPMHDPKQRGEASLDFSVRNGGVHAINVDGTDRRDLTAPGDITTGKQLILHRDWLYWGDREGHRVTRMRIDGTGCEDLVINEPGIENQCVGVTVDPAGDYVYWTQKGPAKGGVGKILRAPLHVPAGTTRPIEVLWDHLPEPIDLEIADGALYWTDRGAEPLGNTVNRAPLPAPGERGAAPQILADGFDEAIGLVVDTEAAEVYVSDLAGHIYRVPLHGGAKRLLADLATPVSGIAGIH